MSNLKRRAKRNLSIVHKDSDGITKTLKSGSFAEISEKNKSAKHDGKVIGMSLGLTKNMDNYESLRVDVWLSDVYETPDDAKKLAEQIRETLGDILEETVRDYI